MTDPNTHRPTRANPLPRRALPRVKPLAAVPEDDERILWAAAHAEGADTATGRDVLIPGGSVEARPAAAEGKPARKGRGAVPALSELMPPTSPRRKRGSHGQVAPEPVVSAPAQSLPAEEGEGKPAKKGELVVTLSKPLRKRLKAKAAGHGMTPQQAVTELISVWVDG